MPTLRRHSRSRLLPLLVGAGLLSSLALTANSAVAGAHEAVTDRPRSAALVCGGLSPDAAFGKERRLLGGAHACEHLVARERSHRHRTHATTSRQVPVSTVSAVRQARAARPDLFGRWSGARNPGTQTIGITAVLLHTGKVLLFGLTEVGGRTTVAYVYDPASGTGHDVPAPAPIFCSSVTPLADGRILTVGGANPSPDGIEDLWLFDPVTETWSQQPGTPLGRYYPTSTRLPDGRVVITAGLQTDGETQNPTVEVYTPPAAGAASGGLSVVGPDHVSATYPHQLVMPDGRLLQVDADAAYRLDPATWTWNRLGGVLETRRRAAAHLLLPAGPRGSTEVMVIGGLVRAGSAVASTRSLDYAAPAAGWTSGSVMPSARAHMNVVQVPDGSAYVVGGNATGQRADPTVQTLHYDPATRRWRGMAMQSTVRTYHSTAVLLPDGRIMSAGDDGPRGGRQSIDFYSPPYLFRGTRPRIAAAPRRVDPRQTFRIRTAGPAATSAVLMAPGATTHANDMNARHVRLAVTRTRTGLRATAPRVNVAPPGWYMLFVLRDNGVPSVAKWVRVGS